MPFLGRRRLPAPLAAVLAAAVVAPAALLAAPAAHADPPTNAGAIFKWGYAAWKDEFLTSRPRPEWTINKSSLVSNKHGMLNIESRRGGRGGTITALASDQAAKYGRWEARVRAHRYTYRGTPYTAVWELVPVNKYRCGAKSIVLSSYAPDDARATGAVRTGPANEFSYGLDLDLTNDVFHTYAIEVTTDHVSWFVDTEVVHTERRPEALSGVKFQPRFRLQAVKGATMDHSRMQMDWARYYTLDRPNQKSIEAPAMEQGTYAGTCAKRGTTVTDPAPPAEPSVRVAERWRYQR
ncbi:hypothetical protein BH11ACT8_BH11ACT8_30390 [soil metagenome]